MRGSVGYVRRMALTVESPAALRREARRRMEEPRFARLTLAAAASLSGGTTLPLAEEASRTGATAEELLFLARVHGVAGLLSRLEEGAGVLPSALRRELAAERVRIGERAEALAADLRAIASAASEEGLDLVPLKGSVLGPVFYRDPSLRPAADLDLLADDGDVARWERLLGSLGYERAAETSRDIVFRRPEERVPTGFEERPDNPRPVELHRHLGVRLLGRTVDPTPSYRSRVAAGTLPGIGRALLPDDDALLLHLLVHLAAAAVGRGARLLQLHDLSLLSPSPGAPSLLTGVLGEAAWGLAHLVVRSLPAALPPSLVAALEASRPPEQRASVWLSRPGLQTGTEERRLLVLAELPLSATWADRLGRLRDAIPEGALLDRTYGGGTGRLRRIARYLADRLGR